MYEGMVGTRGLIMSMCSVGPLQPLTIGIIPWRFFFLRHVFALSEGCR